MPRSGAEARIRLQAAALKLIAEHGFDAVTTAAIAARAGVTERTFFRHFPDKREVLFEGERMLADWVTAAFADVPADVPPWSAMQQVVAAITPSLVRNRPDADRLAAIVAATPALAERAASKQARLVELIAALLVERGPSRLEAEVVAGSGWGVLAAALRVWREPGNSRSLRSLIDEGFATLANAVPSSPSRS